MQVVKQLYRAKPWKNYSHDHYENFWVSAQGKISHLKEPIYK